MNEVTKLYENAEIEPEINYVCDKEPCEQHSVDCQKCSHLYDTREDYPDFTAEKQLELIKFILGKGVYYDTDKNCQEVWFHYTDDIENASYKPFDEAIAEFINILWQDLTEEERKQIKEILSE